MLKADLNVPNRKQQTPLIVAVLCDQWALVSELVLDHRIGINATEGHCRQCAGGKSRETPVLSLMVQRVNDDVTALETILSRKAELRIDAADSKGYTALHYAYARQHDAAVALLVSAGANGAIRGDDGKLAADLRDGGADKKGLARLGSLFQRRSTRTAAVDGGSPSLRSSGTFKTSGTSVEETTASLRGSSPQLLPLKAFVESLPSPSMRRAVDSGAEPGRSATTLIKKAPASACPVSETAAAMALESDDLRPAPSPQLNRAELLHCLIGELEAADCNRRYLSPGRESLPPNVQAWREDVQATRTRQQSTEHSSHSAQLASVLKILDADCSAVEALVTQPQYAGDALETLVAKRQESRALASQLLHQALTSGKLLWALQLEEEEVCCVVAEVPRIILTLCGTIAFIVCGRGSSAR